MIGLDTSFLVAFEIAEHPLCQSARALAGRHSSSGLALAAQVLTEFLHVVTDQRRFSQPLSMEEALLRGRRWWNAREVHHVFPTDQAVTLFHQWIADYGLGRKRLLDTLLAATYAGAQISQVISSNFRDFSVFPLMEAIPLSVEQFARKPPRTS
jgi:predicted nucleic acid-binding protein